MSKFLLIDGTALVFRGFYAIPPRFMTDEGVHTNAIFGFYTILLSLLLNELPDYFTICFDRPEETIRKQMFTEYKANRAKAPDNLYAQIKPIKEILSSAQLNLVELAGYEADDLIATLARKNQQPSLNTLIYSSDFDLVQLVDDNINVLKPGSAKKGNQLVTVKDVQQKYGFSPKQIQDYKGLCGDSSDNLPGVKGIGDKTATKLIQEFQSLENIYKNLDKIAPSIQKKLIEEKDNAFMSKKLATLYDDCNIPTAHNKYGINNIGFRTLKNHLEHWQINKLTTKVDLLEEKLQDVQHRNQQSSLF